MSRRGWRKVGEWELDGRRLNTYANPTVPGVEIARSIRYRDDGTETVAGWDVFVEDELGNFVLGHFQTFRTMSEAIGAVS